MDLKELHYIITIADEGSISKAAEKLFMAQSSLSQFLQLYENELGTHLFMRTSRGVRPTASGKVFIDNARQILIHYHRAQSQIWDIEELRGGQIELGVSTFRGTYLIPRVLKRFHEVYPNVHVEITEKDSLVLEEMIQEGTLDMALLALPTSNLKCQTDFLMKDEVCLVAANSHPIMKWVQPAHPITGRPWVRLEDAAAFEFILGPRKTILGTISRNEFGKRGLCPFSRNSNITAPFAAAMAREGAGLAFTYRSCFVADEQVTYLSVGEDGIFLDLVLAYPVGEYRSKAVRMLGNTMHEVIRAL